jgi:hypothetical protein
MIMLVSGDMLDPFNPDPDMLSIPVIAHHLAMQCRFNGACRRFYSVAEHSVLSADVARDETLARAMLLHDAHEAFLGDVVSPLKTPDILGSDAPIWHAVDAIDLAIQERYGVSFDDERIKLIDSHMLGVEWRELMPEPDRYAHLIDPERITYVSAGLLPNATRWFMQMARELGLYDDQ